MGRRLLIIIVVCLIALTVAAILPERDPLARQNQSIVPLTGSDSGLKAMALELIETPAPEPTPTFALPPEYLTNGQMTIGITIGAAVLILIVVGGTLSILPRKEQ